MVAVPGGRRLPATLASRLAGWLTADLGRAVDLAVVALVLAYCVVLVPGLTRWPTLINDEGREANLFWVASGADPAAERMNAYRGFSTWGNGGLQGATAAVIFRLAGVGVLQARLTSLLWGGLLLLVVYCVGRRYWGRSVGLAAAAMLAISNPFLVATHTLRPDVQVVTMVLGALLLAERSVDGGRARPLASAFLGGLLLGLVVDTHPNGAAFFPLVGLVYPLRLGWTAFLARRVTWVFLLGMVAAAAYYLAVRFLPDPAGFMAGLGYWVGVDKAPPAVRAAGGLGARLSAMLLAEVGRYQDYFGEEPLELLVVLVGLCGGLWMAARGSYPARLIWLGLLFACGFFVLAVSTKSKYYMLLTYPLYLLLLARMLERAAAWSANRLAGSYHGAAPGAAGPISAAILGVLVLVVMIWPLKLDERAWDNYIRARRYREGQDYLELTSRLKELAGPGARILAPPVYWIGMHDHPYADIFVYERVERQYGMTPAQYLDEIRPDLVITDAKIATERRVERLLYNELDTRARYEVIVRHKSYGDVAVYRLTWPDRNR
jgi:4-amino-4-deoxy-L-arabinose transferase-like glycosyltransferase